VVVTNAPITGVCNTNYNSQTLYDFNDGGDSLNSGMALCSSGTVSNFTFNASFPGSNGWMWTCDGQNGGASVSCSATESYCGDGII